MKAPPPAALPPAVLERLVRRVEDYPERAERRLQDYKKKLLQTIEVSSPSGATESDCMYLHLYCQNIGKELCTEVFML